ncbi:MAG: hypothetical protein ACI8S6_003830 [Myxococcota bacterium]|jgi:hypothetical protein
MTMTTMIRWAGVALLGLSLSAPVMAQDKDTSGADLLSEALSVLSADTDSTFGEFLDAIGDEKVTMEAGGVEVVMSGAEIAVTQNGDFVFGTTSYRSSGSYSGTVLAQDDDNSGNADGITIIEEMGIIVIYWDRFIFILY